MVGWILLFLVLIVLIVGVAALADHGYLGPRISGPPNPNVPKIIHLIYYPWTKSQQLKPDPEDFDHTYYHQLQKRFPTYDVKMWTLPKTKQFVQKFYPGVWEIAGVNASRPTQLVDLFRWLVIFHFGGLYLQYDSKIRVENPEQLFPTHGNQVRLFTEFVWFSPLLRHLPAKRFPIRKGKPEEKWRVMNQIFAATPRHPYILQTWTSILARMQRHKPTCDYEILWIGANAYISEFFDQDGAFRQDVQLTSFAQTRSLVSVSSRGSWRTDV